MTNSSKTVLPKIRRNGIVSLWERFSKVHTESCKKLTNATIRKKKRKKSCTRKLDPISKKCPGVSKFYCRDTLKLTERVYV